MSPTRKSTTRPAEELAQATALALPPLDALLVDLDGVVTDTAAVHARAWKRLFDPLLRARAEAAGEPFRPFDAERDYRRHVDGKPRGDGIRDFLAARGIHLPEGDLDDPPGGESVRALGARKNGYFRDALHSDGVAVFASTVAWLHEARRRGLRLAVISSSRNCHAVLEAAGLTDLFDVRVDGTDLARLGLAGKPAPDMLREALRRLRVRPERAGLLEDAIAGVEAGRAAGLAIVVGIARHGDGSALAMAGADRVVAEPGELALADAASDTGRRPS